MRWPAAWADPATLALAEGHGIDTLLIDNSDEFDPLRTRGHAGRPAGGRIRTRRPTASGIVKGEWPGVRSGRGGGMSCRTDRRRVGGFQRLGRPARRRHASRLRLLDRRRARRSRRSRVPT